MTSIIWLSVEGPGPEPRSNYREAAFSPCFTGVLGPTLTGTILNQEGMNRAATENNEKKTGEEDPRPLTDEEFETLKKKEKRTNGIIDAIIDFFTGFFH